jgi:hypothetical protein
VNAGDVVPRAHFHGRCRLDSPASLGHCGGFFFFFFFEVDGKRSFHASRHLRKSALEGKNHYERLKVSTNATPAEIKKY